jgi:hypothetical protein
MLTFEIVGAILVVTVLLALMTPARGAMARHRR